MSFPQFLFKVEVYFNGVKPLIEFLLSEGTDCLTALRSKLNDLRPNTENINVSKIEFREDLIDIDGRMKYNFIELKTDEDLKVM